MPGENIRRKAPSFVFSNYHIGFCRSHSARCAIADAADLHNSGGVTPFNETLFTATSAVCVTGLVVQDTGSYWSAFGQVVILTLIQIGGLGVVTVAASLALLSGRKNIVDAAQHHAGRNFSTSGWRNRSSDTLHPARDVSD